MKNGISVKEMIEILQKFDQDAIICKMEFEDINHFIKRYPVFYNSVDFIKEMDNQVFINADGDDIIGKIIAIS
jgi:hypothetical protein